MPKSLITSFIFYAFIQGITPGPANLCSLSASLRFGWKTALKQWTGLFTGFAVLALASAFLCRVIGAALGDYVKNLSYVGAAYLIFLAYKMLKSTIHENENAADSCNFITGLLVQLTNVKVMLYCVTSLSIYVLPYKNTLPALLSLAVFLPFTGPLCNLVWLFLGDALRNIFRKWQKQVNIVMAVSLVICAVGLVL